MKKIFDIFKIKKEEKWLALGIFLALAVLNGVVIARYASHFTLITDDYYKNFIRHFCVSGFDPLTYWVLSDWNAAYNVYRHPLLAFYMYIPYLINMGLMKLTGYNCALFIAVIIQIFCGFYATLFLKRIFREVMDLAFVRDYDISAPNVRGDRARLTQVFLNIVRNAAEVMDGERAEGIELK